MISKKSLYKTISWRILSVVLSFTLSVVFLEQINKAVTFTVVHALISTILYYYHELFYKLLRRKGFI